MQIQPTNRTDQKKPNSSLFELFELPKVNAIQQTSQTIQDPLPKLKIEIPRWDELKAINTASLRLRNKRVIIVVDDADEEKLEKLAGHRNWFGPGSRIILTTEDKGMMEKKCGEKNVYQAKKLNASDALKLFIREAFNEPPCGKDLLDICNGFVRYVDGHPLALKILGSAMYGITNIDQWEAELERVRKSPELPDDRTRTALGI